MSDILSRFNLTDDSHHKILMLKEAHFHGQFDVMLEHFGNENFLGNNLDIEIQDIEYLAQIEQQLQTNLATLILSCGEAERVYKSRKMYAHLKEVYLLQNDSQTHGKVIADLLLVESLPCTKEINAVVQLKDVIVPQLINIVNNSDLYDPVFPGFGEIPKIAVECLGLIKNKETIPFIFSLFGQENFSDDDLSLILYRFNYEAKNFLKKILESLPITKDHEKAAFCLTRFDDLETVMFCEKLIYLSNYHQNPLLVYYLINIATQYPNPNLKSYIKEKIYQKLPKNLQKELDLIVQDWH